MRGGRLVFSGLSFDVGSGGLLAVTGPNGSGKSSLLRILAGLLRPETGTLLVHGRTGEQPVAHFIGHTDALKPALTLHETLRFWTAIYRGRGHIGGSAGRVGLGHALELPVGVLSAGQRRRASLARLLIAPRPLWLLDEPSSALDREGEAVLAGLIREQLASGGVVVAATHQELPVAPDAVLELSSAA